MWAQIASAGVGLVGSAYQMFQGAKEKKEAQKDLNEFEFQELENAYDGIEISTMGSDLITEESARMAASGIEASRQGGIRGILGALPRIQSQTNAMNREASIGLDKQVQQRTYSQAADKTKIRSMQEQRDNAELEGIQNRLAAGKTNQMQGIRGMGNALVSGVSATSGVSGASATSKFNPNALSDLPNLEYGKILNEQQEQNSFSGYAPKYGM